MQANTIVNQLLSSIDPSLVNELLDEYKAVKMKQLSGDWGDCLVHCGKFAELTMAIVKMNYDKKVDKNKIQFDELYRDFIKRSKPSPEDEILLLAIPNAAKAMYTIRNKKKAAHFKEINPDFIDGAISSEICDWILSQFILIKCRSSPSETAKFVNSLIERTIPLIEEFEDGSLVILKIDVRFIDKLLLSLYRLNKRVANNEIKRVIKVKYPEQLRRALSDLEDNVLIHRNNSGVRITQLGTRKAEEIIKKHSFL